MSYVEDDLYERLFKYYQKNSIAKLDGGGPVQVKVGFTLIQLNHLVSVLIEMVAAVMYVWLVPS